MDTIVSALLIAALDWAQNGENTEFDDNNQMPPEN